MSGNFTHYIISILTANLRFLVERPCLPRTRCSLMRNPNGYGLQVFPQGARTKEFYVCPITAAFDCAKTAYAKAGFGSQSINMIPIFLFGEYALVEHAAQDDLPQLHLPFATIKWKGEGPPIRTAVVCTRVSTVISFDWNLLPTCIIFCCYCMLDGRLRI